MSRNTHKKPPLPSLKLPDVKAELTTAGPGRERVFFSNDNANVRAEIKAWLEYEYPRYFDPTSPLNFHNMEERLTKAVVEVEKNIQKRFDLGLSRIKQFEDSVSELKDNQKQVDAINLQMKMLKEQAERLETQTTKLLSSSLWTRIRFLFFK